MNIAICLTGFIRNLDYINNIKKFYDTVFCSNLVNLNIYYSCPRKLEENDVNFDESLIIDLFKKQESEKIKINIVFRDYDKMIYVEKARKINLPYITSNKYHSHRIISCLNGYSETARLISNSEINYNFIIFSRLDIIKNIISINKIFDNNQVLKNSMYIWRTVPYISTGDLSNHVEDRFFICSSECINLIKEIYNYIDQINIEEKNFFTEYVLGDFFNKHSNIQKYHLYNLEVSDDFIIYQTNRINIKYTDDFLNKM